MAVSGPAVGLESVSVGIRLSEGLVTGVRGRDTSPCSTSGFSSRCQHRGSRDLVTFPEDFGHKQGPNPAPELRWDFSAEPAHEGTQRLRDTAPPLPRSPSGAGTARALPVARPLPLRRGSIDPGLLPAAAAAEPEFRKSRKSPVPPRRSLHVVVGDAGIHLRERGRERCWRFNWEI